MKFIRIKSIAYLFLICVLMCGCDYRNYFYTEDSLKKVAEKSLEEKYGEEFVIHRVWERSQEMFFADCSPKDNPEVIFTADINKNGDGIVADGYAQGVIKKEVDNLLKDDFNELFGDCYTRPYISNYYNVPEFLNAKDITIQEYISEVDADVICLYYSVYVDASQLSNDTVEQEREYLCNEIPKKIKNKIIPNLSIYIYFTTDELINRCKEYFSTHVDTDYDINRELDKYPCISLEYNKDGKLDELYKGSFLNPKYGEYQELRKDIDRDIPKEDELDE